MRLVVLFVLVGIVWLCFPRRAAAEWPSLHRDYQRSGYTDEIVRGPCQRKWCRSFVDEMIGARVEAIVAEGRGYVGTYAGNVYALDIDTGATIWQYRAGGRIGHSPCYHAGALFVCTDEGFAWPRGLASACITKPPKGDCSRVASITHRFRGTTNLCRSSARCWASSPAPRCTRT